MNTEFNEKCFSNTQCSVSTTPLVTKDYNNFCLLGDCKFSANNATTTFDFTVTVTVLKWMCFKQRKWPRQTQSVPTFPEAFSPNCLHNFWSWVRFMPWIASTSSNIMSSDSAPDVLVGLSLLLVFFAFLPVLLDILHPIYQCHQS